MAKVTTKLAGDIARDLVRKFPKAGALTLAKKAYKENKGVWMTVEAARCCIRTVLGVHGVKNRKAGSVNQEFHRAPRKAGTSFPKLPEPLRTIDDWKWHKFDVAGPCFILSDVHIPFYDKQAIEVAVKYAKKRKVSSVLLNGDIGDFYDMSFFEKDPRKRDFPGELRALRDFLGWIRGQFPKAEILYKLGNHEERYERYMMVKAAEMLGMSEFEFGEITHANKYGMEIVKDKRPVGLGKLAVLHGHEFRRGITAPVNPARGLYMRAKVSALQGDCHQTSSHSEPDLSGHLVTCWSAGCLCELHPAYFPINKWNHGFAIPTIYNDGAYELDNFRILRGEVYR